MTGFTLDGEGEYKVVASCTSTATGQTFQVRAKYIVGADGGSSTVRSVAGIPFEGSQREDRWVRLDAIVKSTNMPEHRAGSAAIESPTHGHVLWVAQDKRITRIGYALNPELIKKYGRQMTMEQAVFEAKAAVAPFTCEFEKVDWYTVYSIKQRVAERLIDRERIILVGDAAHVHSSALAQGMNTGIHDIFNLCWRLEGVLKGRYVLSIVPRKENDTEALISLFGADRYKHEILENYSEERCAIAKQLIENDRIVTALMAGEIPDRFAGSKEDPLIIMDRFLAETRHFTTGLSIRVRSFAQLPRITYLISYHSIHLTS